ncbi:MAG TPA: Hpt domain-containing protein [Chthoniobacter sp.]|nr:Hpt domain-containing protein [Chthoniobacter sp.]
MNDRNQIDTQALARLNSIGGSSFVREMIELFLADAPKRLQAVRDAQAVGDLIAISEATHALKSSARTLGSNHLHALASQIESMTRFQQSENLPALLDDLEQACRASCHQLEGEKQNYPR